MSFQPNQNKLLRMSPYYPKCHSPIACPQINNSNHEWCSLPKIEYKMSVARFVII